MFEKNENKQKRGQGWPIIFSKKIKKFQGRDIPALDQLSNDVIDLSDDSNDNYNYDEPDNSIEASKSVKYSLISQGRYVKKGNRI